MTDLRSAEVPGPRADDHVRGPDDAPVVLFYGDFACPKCAVAYHRLKPARVRLTFRHFALKAKHPRAVALAHAVEAAGAQGRFWELTEALYADQGRLEDPHLWAHCERLGIDLDRFERDRRGPRGGRTRQTRRPRRAAGRCDRDADRVDRTGRSGTARYHGCVRNTRSKTNRPADRRAGLERQHI